MSRTDFSLTREDWSLGSEEDLRDRVMVETAGTVSFRLRKLEEMGGRGVRQLTVEDDRERRFDKESR